MFSYATKADLEKAAGADTSKLAAKSDLVRLKAKVDKLDTGKLVSVPIYLSILNDVLKNDFVKKTLE